MGKHQVIILDWWRFKWCAIYLFSF